MKDDMYAVADDWIKTGHRVALATVIATWGSSPRPVGSQLVIDDDGAFEGSVSGGCIEGAVIAEALDVIGHGNPQRMFFGVSSDQAQAVGLACGGEIEIFIEKIFSRVLVERTGGPAKRLSRGLRDYRDADGRENAGGAGCTRDAQQPDSRSGRRCRSH